MNIRINTNDNAELEEDLAILLEKYDIILETDNE